MLVYFLRHAEAEPDAGSDYQRKLTVKGLEQAEKVAKYCVRHGLVPDLLLSSPVIRAKQTASAVAEKLGVDLMEEHWIACGMSPESCLRELAAYEDLDSVMIVGHEPDFSETIAAMIGLASSRGVNIRKASLTAVELSAFKPGAGELQFSVPCRLM